MLAGAGVDPKTVTVVDPAEYPVSRLDDLTRKADTAWDALRYVEAYYDFSEVPE